MTALVAVDETAFDLLVVAVQAKMPGRIIGSTGYFEVCVEALDDDAEGFTVWLCGRCGKDVNGRVCAEHDNDDLPGYYETWSRTAHGNVVGRCRCGRSTTRRTCAKHIRMAMADAPPPDDPEVVR